MVQSFRAKSLPARLLFAAILSSSPLWLGACASGAGGSEGSQPPAPPPPAPPLPPPPPPPPPSGPSPTSFETGEYNRAVGLSLIKASSAFSRGATGSGIIVAVIDAGSLQDHPDLLGQFTGPTHDVNAATRGAGDIDKEGHGTLVTGIIAAKRDGAGILGVAFGSRILDIRADRPGSCAEDDGCRYPASDVARAINHAVDNGAKVINLSLGVEAGGSSELIENAILAAAQRGVLVVISAGNDAEPPVNGSAPKGTSPSSPARVAGDPGNLGRVVAVGAVTASTSDSTPDRIVGKIAGFSNRAGPQAQSQYILAPGQGVVSTGPDDDIVFPGNPDNDPDTIGDYYRISGTSFAAPYVAGSLALLLQAFPNLQARPQDALKILLNTADDYVDPNPDPVTGQIAGIGIDTVSGVGTLNLQRAFEPQGSAAAFINNQRVPLELLAGSPLGAFGDWAEAGGLLSGISLIDDYDRTFEFDGALLSQAGAAPLPGLADMSASFGGVSRAFRAGDIDMSWHTPRLHEDRAAPFQPEPASSFSATLRLANGDVSAGRGGSLPRIAPGTHLVADPGTPNGLSVTGNWAFVTQAFGAATIDAFTAADKGVNRYGAGVSTSGYGWTLRSGLESVEDTNSALGGAVQSRLGAVNEGNLTAWTVEGRRDLGTGWLVSGGFEVGRVDLGGVAAPDVRTSRWSIGAERGLGAAAVSFVLAQPRRSESGVLVFSAVTGADTEGWIIQEREIALMPSGRQLNLETRLRWSLLENWTAEGAFALVHQPNHVAKADEAGIVWLGVRGRF